MKKLLTILFIAGVSQALFAQGDIDDQEKVFYRNERTVGINLNSNGFGISYREGKRLDFLNKRIIDIDLNIIKHPKEVKLSNPWVQTSGSFVYGKQNEVYSIRGALGHQHEMFRKMDLGGVSVRYFYSGGISLALAKPIYYNVLYYTPASTYQIKQEKFTADIIDPSYIYNKASFFKGVSETKVYPGLSGKAGFSFEYSKEDKVIHSLELGTSFEAYTRKLPIMATDDNRAVFLTLFVSYRIGIVIDPMDPGSNRMPGLFFRK
ncbi:MAG: hypothetical protein V2I34_03045 [Bacteroidales bacterium]|jgi:hypothetical protein|nr:hypothetical protein [Bacteroidales bacterium]